MRTVLLQDPLEIIFSLSFLITFHTNLQAVTHTNGVHLKDTKQAPLRDFGASMTRVRRGQLEKVNN